MNDRAAERRAWWSWFLTIVALCIVWSVAMPALSGPDEGLHVVRAAAVAEGDVGSRDVFTPFLWMSEVRAPGTWGRLAQSVSCFIGHPDVTPRCVRHVAPDSDLRWTFAGSNGNFPPLYYIGVAAPARFLVSNTGVWAMRLLGALACAAFLASAFVSAGRLGTWAVLGVAAAVVPLVLYLAGTVNPSGVELASAVCLWATVASLARGPVPDTRLVVRASIAFIVFANTRGLSLPMAFVALLAPLFLANRARIRELAASTAVRASGIAVVAGTTAALLWTQLRGRVPTSAYADTRFTLFDGLGRTWRVFGEGVASFGYTEVRDLLAIFITAALWGVLLVVGLRAGVPRERVVLLAIGAIALIFPIVVSLVHPPPLYTAWQGRHGLPLWIGVPIVAGAIAGTTARVATPSSRVVIVFAALIGVAHLSAFATASHRYVVGRSGPVLYFIRPRWSGPVPPFILLGLMVIASGALVWRVASATASLVPRGGTRVSV